MRSNNSVTIEQLAEIVGRFVGGKLARPSEQYGIIWSDIIELEADTSISQLRIKENFNLNGHIVRVKSCFLYNEGRVLAIAEESGDDFLIFEPGYSPKTP